MKERVMCRLATRKWVMDDAMRKWVTKASNNKMGDVKAGDTKLGDVEAGDKEAFCLDGWLG